MPSSPAAAQPRRRRRSGRLTLALTGFPYAISGVFNRVQRAAVRRRTTYMAHPKTDPAASWIHRDDHIFGIATIAGVIGVAFLVLLFFLVHNWGWWRPKVPASRSRYVKTWHGWVDRAKHGENLRRRQEKKDTLRSFLGWKSRSTKMASTKSLNKMLKWWRIRRTGVTEPHVELGLQQQHKDVITAYQKDLARQMVQVDGPPSEMLTVRSGRFMTGGILSSEGAIEEGSTIRKRRGSTAETSVWQANSSETSRVSRKIILNVLFM